MNEEIEHSLKADAVMTLTPRETKAFHVLLKGMKEKEIASEASVGIWGVNYFVK